jgi:FkbM family methyltransferase|tara:strand:+ start:3515 stop:4360 length:846 start_codon:yes stop_codon:yes gene_type:complete
MSTQIEIINPVDGSRMVWLKNEFTEVNYDDMNHQSVQKAVSLELVLEMGKGYLDAGANLGDFGIPMALALKNIGRSDIKVYCIDPDLNKCEFMKEIVKLNNLDDASIQIINVGLSDKVGNFSLNPYVVVDCGDYTGAWQYMEDEDGMEFTTLDKLWKSGIIGPIGLFNLDAQWAEERILTGGTEFLTTYKPLILMEYWVVTGRFADGSVHTAIPGYADTRGRNSTFDERSFQLMNDDEFKKIFDILDISVSKRKYNTEKITKFGEHPWKEWDILLEFNKKD